MNQLDVLMESFREQYVGSRSEIVDPAEQPVVEQEEVHVDWVHRKEAQELVVQYWAPVVAVLATWLLKCLVICCRSAWVSFRRGRTLQRSLLDASGWESMGKEAISVLS